GVKVWDVEKGEELATLTSLNGQVTSLAFSPDGKSLAGTSQLTDQTELKLWGMVTFQECFSFREKSFGPLSIRFTPGGEALVLNNGQDIRQWDTATRPDRGSVLAHDRIVKGVACLPDGKTYVTVAGNLYLWDAVTGRRRAMLPGDHFLLSR